METHEKNHPVSEKEEVAGKKAISPTDALCASAHPLCTASFSPSKPIT
jgi:hypothetical protein